MTSHGSTTRLNSCWLLLGLLLLCDQLTQSSSIDIGVEQLARVKDAAFMDPNTGYQYRVSSYNITSMRADATHRSMIRVSRIKINTATNQPEGQSEHVQSIKFHPTLVDFDLHCLPTHCYMVTVTSRTKQNVELFAWQRTQFDSKAKRDSFARAYSVKLFRVQSGFYIAIAQEQIHLHLPTLQPEYEEPTRFIGSAILKFTKGHEHDLSYHQFIKLRFHPLHVKHFTSTSSDINSTKPIENHYLVFSIEPDWQVTSPYRALTFIWSPLNDYFWPYKLPREVKIAPDPRTKFLNVLQFPSHLHPHNLTQLNSADRLEPVESCFNQLQRLLIDREIHSRRLIGSSQSLWRSPQQQNPIPINGRPQGNVQPTKISAQVIVHGNVIVRGSLIQSPQIALVGQTIPINSTLTHLVNAHSPALVENKLKQAHYKLSHIRDKLSRAVPAHLPFINTSSVNTRVKFYGPIQANRVIFRSGVINSNVRLNRIPFSQLEHELVSLDGKQEIEGKVTFKGKVVADLLEIHGTVNGAYRFKDALDITSRFIQVIDSVGSVGRPGTAALDFNSVVAPELIISPNATFNDIVLNDFITRDDRPQIVLGSKSFKFLSMGKLDVSRPSVLLNGYDIGRMAANAIRLRDSSNRLVQRLGGNLQTFTSHVFVDRLFINNQINRQINISSLIYDSVKSIDVGPQQISGFKHFRRGLHVSQLTTDGSINNIQVNQIFNLNPTPPTSDFKRYESNLLAAPPITGSFNFMNHVTIQGNLNAGLINGIDITKRAIRRSPLGSASIANMSQPQLVAGRKIFLRPLRITNGLRLYQPDQSIRIPPGFRPDYPMINGIDLRAISEGIRRQMERPPAINIEELIITGNLYLQTAFNGTGAPMTTFGNFSVCPLDLFRTRSILGDSVEQFIEVPVRVDTLRSRSAVLDRGAFNGFNFPDDFVIRSAQGSQQPYEQVLGHKSFQHLSIFPDPRSHPPIIPYRHYDFFHQPPRSNGYTNNPGVVFGSAASVNDVTYGQLQDYMSYERNKNSTGEIVFQTLNVYGNIFAKSINGYDWPNDILLKSVPPIHRRIYSPLVFTDPSHLNIENRLVLRGPIHLRGYLNGVNLTQFSIDSATYGDKDLFSAGRPIRNKVFAGGLTVKEEIRSQGFIDGVNFEEMKNRVVTINTTGPYRVDIIAPKVFLSDVQFLAPITAAYLNDMLLDNYLRRIQFGPGNTIQVFGKKTITGTIYINQNLVVQGPINSHNFLELQAKAISLSPKNEQLEFNRTLTIEGDVFMDNLLIDEKDGVIDGVKLANLIPINRVDNNDLSINWPFLTWQNTTQGRSMQVVGKVNDCNITCVLAPTLPKPLSQPPVKVYQYSGPLNDSPQPFYGPRPVLYNGRNVTYIQTPPPYATTNFYRVSPPPPQPASLSRPRQQQYIPYVVNRSIVQPDQKKIMQSLATRKPVAIRYEHPSQAVVKKYVISDSSPIITSQLEFLRSHIVTLNLIRLSKFNDLVVGFIEASSNDIANLILPEQPYPHSGHTVNQQSVILLDQIDFPFQPTTYHLSVGVSTTYQRQNVTAVFSSVGGSDLQRLSVLPVESPNSAMFLIAEHQTLFLLISQDYTVFNNQENAAMCPRYKIPPSTGIQNNYEFDKNGPLLGGVHVYLFHALENSSSLKSAYFDLHQTINLPQIDSFENFNYRGSTYALAISRKHQEVHLLLLRGYSGFQHVNKIPAPMVESVKVLFSNEQKPVLIIHQTNGIHKLMDSVII